jgi:DNA-binding NarL/FixJ family response regulator
MQIQIVSFEGPDHYARASGLATRMTGLAQALAKPIRAAVPGTEILIFTMRESEELIRAALASGVRAMVVKSDAEGHLLAAVESILRHDVYFSSRVSGM